MFLRIGLRIRWLMRREGGGLGALWGYDMISSACWMLCGWWGGRWYRGNGIGQVVDRRENGKGLIRIVAWFGGLVSYGSWDTILLALWLDTLWSLPCCPHDFSEPHSSRLSTSFRYRYEVPFRSSSHCVTIPVLSFAITGIPEQGWTINPMEKDFPCTSREDFWQVGLVIREGCQQMLTKGNAAEVGRTWD